MVSNGEFVKGMENATVDLVRLMEKRVEKTSLFVKGQAVKLAPSDTGQLRASMTCATEIQKDCIRGIVGNTALYAPYVHQGTGIYAKDGNGRKTRWKVKTVYKGKRVCFWTYGIRPNPFLEKAVSENIEEIKALLGGD